jgi:hypothetical protein
VGFLLGGSAPLTAEQLVAQAQAQARIKKSADPAILARVERWTEHRMVPLHPALPLAIRPQPTHFERLADWYAGYLGVRGEYEAPYELQRDLKAAVPQAILRDIYRPVRGQQFIEPERHELDIDPGGRRALAEARAALSREPIPTIQPGLLVVIREQRRRRRFVERPWASFRADEAPRRYSEQDHIRYSEEEDDDE